MLIESNGKLYPHQLVNRQALSVLQTHSMVDVPTSQIKHATPQAMKLLAEFKANARPCLDDMTMKPDEQLIKQAEEIRQAMRYGLLVIDREDQAQR